MAIVFPLVVALFLRESDDTFTWPKVFRFVAAMMSVFILGLSLLEALERGWF